MCRTRHKWRKRAFHFLLAITGLALFTAQLSYKFYLHANVPIAHASCRQLTHETTGISHLALQDHQNREFPYLDKRYDSKHIFELFTPLAQHLYFLPVRELYEFYSPSGQVVSGAPINPALRGPPANSFV